MNTKPKSFLSTILRVMFGLLLLFLGYRMVIFEFRINKFEKAFLQAEHPKNTERIDSLVLEINDYPATYVNDSIQFQSAFLVGEIRSYDGNWDAMKTFYINQQLEVRDSNLLPVWPVPLQIEHNEQRSSLDFPDDFFSDPFQAYVLQALQDHYPSKKLTQRLGGTEGSLYFVYMHADP